MKDRLVLIFIGYLVSVALATFFETAVISWFESTHMGEELQWNMKIPILELLYLGSQLFLVTFAVFLVPSCIVVLLSEWRGWHSPFFYAMVGAAFSLLVTLDVEPSLAFSILGCAIGAFVGTVYWAIAGRNSGLRPQTST